MNPTEPKPNAPLTERDKMLIEAAYAKHFLDWCDIDENAADTEEGRKILHGIAVQKYHQEEASIGMLHLRVF